MSAGGFHVAAGVLVATAVVYADHLDPRPLEVAVTALAASTGPDIDNGKSLMGCLVPQLIAPDRAIPGYPYSERLLFGVIPIRHRGPTHSYLVGLLIAWALATHWLRAALELRLTALPAPDLGLVLGLTFLVAWTLHLRMDPGAKQLLWPLSLRWMR
jgi:membrane-bound metal-dependent hydrolase YbcI (DUF457 family)